jgi:hypothetical protein
MRIFRTFVGYAFAALACLGYSGLSFGYDLPSYTYHAFIEPVGRHGAEAAKFKAEMTHAVAMDSVLAAERTGLLTDGHGFLQARADATVGQGVGNQVSLS